MTRPDLRATWRNAPVAACALLLAACAAQYDAADQENLDTLLADDTPTLDALLEQQEQVVSTREEAATALPEIETETPDRPDELGSPTLPADRNVAEAIEQYRAILELAPDDERMTFETRRRLADLQVEASELDPRLEQQGIVSQSEAVALYNGLLDARPNAANNDRILYQLARAYQNLGEMDKAIDTLAELTRDFPGSRLQTDARFRRAELLFRGEAYREAGEEYRRVMEASDGGGFYEQAQYKYGWSLYKQDRYEESLETFVLILDRELPVGAVENLEATLDVIPRAQRELVRDVLRVVSLAFVQLGGGPAVTEFLQGRPERSYEPVLYANLAELYIDKERAVDAAEAYYGLSARSPRHPLAPIYAARVVDIYDKAGFDAQVIAAKERYVDSYALGSDFWQANTREGSPEAYATLVTTTRELAEHWHASARASSGAAAQADLRRAAPYYERYVVDFPETEDRVAMRYSWADVLFSLGELEPAATQFAIIAREHRDHPRAPDAAYALVLARQQLLDGATPETRAARLQDLIAASRALQQNYPSHPQVAAALTRSAEELAEAGFSDQARGMAEEVLALEPAAAPELRLANWRIVAYAHYDAERYAQAEQAFAQWLTELPADSAERRPLMEAQANSIYRQAVAARDAGRLAEAAAQFLRVKTALPGSELAADADYDAASAYLQAEDWASAIATLQAYRQAWPEHRLQLEATRRLAAAYLEIGDEVAAAGELERLSQAPTLAAPVRRDALWQAAGLYEGNNVADAARRAYGQYFTLYGAATPKRQVQALEKLLALAPAGSEERSRWLREAVTLASRPGAQDEGLRVIAAEAALELAEGHRAVFAARRLSHPLERSLTPKKAAMEQALAAYRQVIDFGYLESTTQSTFRIGELYYDLARALMQLPPPPGISDPLEVEQYTLLLEEQAFPLEERAAEAHEANAQRLGEGINNDWVRRSMTQLAKILPARYGKTELVEEVIDDLR